MQVLYNSLSNLHPYCRARICVSVEILIGDVRSSCLVSSGNLLPYITANWLLLHMVSQRSCWWDQESDQSCSLCHRHLCSWSVAGKPPGCTAPMHTCQGKQPCAAFRDVPPANPTRVRGQRRQQRCTEERHPSQWEQMVWKLTIFLMISDG